MFILNDLLRPLQAAFKDTEEGQERGHWFVWVLLAVIVLGLALYRTFWLF